MRFICKLPLMRTFYKHPTVRVCFRYRFFNCFSLRISAVLVIIVIFNFLALLLAFFSNLFAKLLFIHLCCLGDLFLLELLFICRCLNVSPIKIMLGSTIRWFRALFRICTKISSLSSGGESFAKGITYRCKVGNFIQ